MTRDPITLLTRTLADRADAVAAPPAGLADAAARQARARRRHQVVGATVGAVAVAAGVLATTVLPVSGDRAEDQPAGPTAPLTVPDDAVTRVAPDGMPRGVDPGVAWTAGAILHRSDGRSLGLPLGPVSAAEAPGGGGVIGATTTSDAALRLVDVDGHASAPMDISWPVGGVDGRYAYLDRADGSLVTVPLGGGAGSSAAVPIDIGGATLVGWLGDDLVANLPGRNARVLTTDGGVHALGGLPQATATDGRSTVASRSVDGSCLQVRRAGALLWRSCDNPEGFTSVVALSPDSHHALLRRPTSRGGGEYAVVDTETGEVVRLFAARADADVPRTGLGQAVFETDDHVLLSVFVGPGESVVRCSLAGACEVAVSHGDLPDGAAGPQPFDPAWVP